MSKLPFDRRIFWSVFLVVMALVLLTFYLFFKFSAYQLTNADRFGSLISASILSYLVHLWLLPPEFDDDEYEDYDEDDEYEDEAEAGDSGETTAEETEPETPGN